MPTDRPTDRHDLDSSKAKGNFFPLSLLPSPFLFYFFDDLTSSSSPTAEENKILQRRRCSKKNKINFPFFFNFFYLKFQVTRALASPISAGGHRLLHSPIVFLFLPKLLIFFSSQFGVWDSLFTCCCCWWWRRDNEMISISLWWTDWLPRIKTLTLSTNARRVESEWSSDDDILFLKPPSTPPPKRENT